MFQLTGTYVSSIQISLIEGKSTDIYGLYEVPDSAQSISYIRNLVNSQMQEKLYCPGDMNRKKFMCRRNNSDSIHFKMLGGRIKWPFNI